LIRATDDVTVVLWKGGDSRDEQFNVCNLEFCIKRAVV